MCILTTDMGCTKTVIWMLCMLILEMSEIMTTAYMIQDPMVHPVSIDQAISTTDQLAKLTKRMDELEHMHSKDVNELNARVNELSELRENDARVILQLNQHVEELERVRVKDLYVITMLTQRVGEMERQHEQFVHDIAKELPIPPKVGTESYNISDVTSPTHATPAPEHTTMREEKIASHIKTLSSKITAKSSRIQSRHHRKITRVSPSDNVVAFHVILTHTIDDPAKNSPVMYDHLITNSGGAHYSTNTGVFTCTQPGVHVFSWSIYVGAHQYIDSDLIRNNAIIGSAEIAQGTGYGGAGSATAAAHLEIGDEVWVRVAGHDSGSDILPARSMFTGFRLR